jgi:hypothetical protein
MRIRGLALVALLGLTAAGYWSCGGDNENGAIFNGEVSSVSASLPAREPRSRGLAFLLPEIPSRAHAQASCPAPGARALLIFCIRTASFEVCQPVDPASCTFSLTAVLDGGPSPLAMTFVDDTNANVEREPAERASTVQQSLVYCNEDQVQITNAMVNFTSGATTANVSKKVDRCRNVTATPTRSGTPATPLPTVTGTPPTPTPTRTGTAPTPTRTGTPPTPLPTPTTYGSGASLRQSPSSMLAFLFSAGAVGLLLPRRRRRPDRRE